MVGIAKRLGVLAMLSLVGLGWSTTASAAPAQKAVARGDPPHGDPQHGDLQHVDLRAPLDLRPPAASLLEAHALAPEPQKPTFAAFPTAANRQLFAGVEPGRAPETGSPDGRLSYEGQRGRIPGRVEALARRLHQEGLPLARLWENKAALVSLGLNQKGKPGLWIVQKVR